MRARERWLLAILPFALLAGALVADAETIDPDDDGSQYAWTENAGWLNAEPLGDGGPGIIVTRDELQGWIWSENAGWISLSCENTASCAVVDYGVSHDGNGSLAGWAWGENIGWIGFSCENTSSCGSVDFGVEIDLVSGSFSGWAWGENVGWISFSCANTTSCTSVDYGVRSGISWLIFADGFESGDTLAWSRSLP